MFRNKVTKQKYEKILEILENSKNNFQVRIRGLQRRSDVSNEQIKIIFNILNQIKN
ncbi:hypothetical protein [Clostridium sp. ZS2-4]|uniref:hypothetical protein n=1 Tax=Clostridium sp. ZS2-4 TaxID=2987703 RepID=UPI00227CC5FC|nr:hypothetical protein [Clostridium sp. ZS2-4]MCY6354937.1 hypothetical protein [Clostridium sp. ZS2-4]